MRRTLTGLCSLCLCLVVSAGGQRAAAQLHRASDSVAAPVSSLISQGDAVSMDVNPAAIGLLPSWSLAYVHAEVDQQRSWLGRGDALYLASPLAFGLAMGVTVQSLRPGTFATRPLTTSNADRALAALSLALSSNRHFSFGLTSRVLASGNSRIDDLASFDVGMAWRPSSWLGFGLVGRDLFITRSGEGTAGLDLGSSVAFNTTLRPGGTSHWAFDFAVAMDDEDTVAGRGGMSLRVPHLGLASGGVEVERLGDDDAALRIMAELAVNWGRATVAGGTTFGDGFGGDAGWYGMLRMEGRERPGLPVGRKILDLELSGVSSLGMLRVALALDRALHDDRIAGVLLRPRGSGMGHAYAQEVRLQIEALRAAGKPVVCHLDGASASEYYACSAANEVLIDPAGNVRLMGTSMRVVLFGDTLRKVGLRADFVRIGDYKSAPEQFTQRVMSEPAREETRALLDGVHHRMLFDLAKDLDVSQVRVAEIMDRGPHLAKHAVKDNLVGGVQDEFVMSRKGLGIFDRRAFTRSLPPTTFERWGLGPRVGVLMIDGNIVDGDNVDIPIFGVHMTGAHTAIAALQGMVADPTIRSIVVRVDSPGGSVLASDQLWRAIRRAREVKPVIASMGSVAASGGYYVACAADEIWADPSTLTGSIGIFYGKVDVAGLADDLGIGIETFQRGKRAGAESMWRPFTADERGALSKTLRVYYQTFLERVAEGRDMKVAQVDRLARGRVYTGDAALRHGLVDKLGGFASALARARRLGRLGDDAGVVVRPARRDRLLDFVLSGGVGVLADEALEVDASEGADLPMELRSAVRVMTTLNQMGGADPLALLPYDIEF